MQIRAIQDRDLHTAYELAWTQLRGLRYNTCMAPSLDKSESAILARALGPEDGNLSPELAEHVLSIGLTEVDQRAAQELALLAKEGKLTPDQSAELENYRRAGRIFEFLKSKARIALRQADSSR